MLALFALVAFDVTVKVDPSPVAEPGPYLIRPDYSLEWGFSTRGKISDRWKLLA